MEEILIKEIEYTKNTIGKENLKMVLEYLRTLETIIYKIHNMGILNDEELEVYKKVAKVGYKKGGANGL